MTLQKSHWHILQHKKIGSKLIENAISQALTKGQDVTISSATVDSRHFRVNHTTNSSYETN